MSRLVVADLNAKFIRWNFPFVSQELQTRFGLHGYVVLRMCFQKDFN